MGKKVPGVVPLDEEIKALGKVVEVLEKAKTPNPSFQPLSDLERVEFEGYKKTHTREERKTREQKGLDSTLESLVDTFSMESILLNLQDICFRKADHLRGNWQDENSARCWERIVPSLQRAESKACDLGLV